MSSSKSNTKNVPWTVGKATIAGKTVLNTYIGLGAVYTYSDLIGDGEVNTFKDTCDGADDGDNYCAKCYKKQMVVTVPIFINLALLIALTYFCYARHKHDHDTSTLRSAGLGIAALALILALLTVIFYGT